MARIKMHISKAKLPFYPPYEVKYRLQKGKYRLQNEVSTHISSNVFFFFFIIIFFYESEFSYICNMWFIRRIQLESEERKEENLYPSMSLEYQALWHICLGPNLRLDFPIIQNLQQTKLGLQRLLYNIKHLWKWQKLAWLSTCDLKVKMLYENTKILVA